MNPQNRSLPRLQHVTITFLPGQEQRLRNFYLNVIGLQEKPVPRVGKPFGWIWFPTGDEAVELHCVPAPEPVPENSPHRFCLQVDDREGCRRRIERGGYQIWESRPLPF